MVSELKPEDEFGQIEATFPPGGYAFTDPYIRDLNYDPALAKVDPETMGDV